MKVVVNGEETEIETRDDLFIKIGDEWYVKTINIEAQILQELEEWLKETSYYEEYDRVEQDTMNMILNKIQKLKEKYK